MIWVLLISFIFVFYYTYKYSWNNIIRLFESLSRLNNNNSSNLNLYINDPIIGTNDDYRNDLKILKPFQLLEEKDSFQLNQIAKVIFTINVSVTVLVIQSILIQFMYIDDKIDSNDEYYLLWLWNFLIYTSVLNLILIQPFLIFFILFDKINYNYNNNNYKPNNLKFLVKFFTSFLFTILWIGLISSFDKITDLNVNNDGFIHSYLQKIGIIGITLISSMNGLGSISTFYYYLYQFLIFKLTKFSRFNEFTESKKKNYDDLLSNLYQKLRSTEQMINDKQLELQNKNFNNNSNQDLNKRINIKPKGSFIDLKSLFQSSFESSSSSSTSNLSIEINSLNSIRNEIIYKIEKITKNSIPIKNSLNYRIKFYLQRIFAIYCILKILQVSIVKILTITNGIDPTTSSDPLVLTIINILKIFITIKDDEFIINQLSFLISGIFFIFSLNGIYILLSHIYRFIPIGLIKLTTSVKNLILSEIFGIYILSTLFILKSNLTKKFNSKLNNLLHLSNNDIFAIDSWFDKIYLISVIVTFIGIKISEIWYNDDDDDEAEDYHYNSIDKLGYTNGLNDNTKDDNL
ncbi:hypothetical protein WICMUC_004672 [Wickerhamomyces mucosus]|uniref:Abscisic acid G-protein coupled receptor-like domain-containing protein n=1 Tax=Wickerhamomyces mucosus TaxID=1378264 RepID=A0A9P8TAI7_9ASCO|nr:hypothetical protein WICMUC_004672 [Wickerhamomyces mucosus]